MIVKIEIRYDTDTQEIGVMAPYSHKDICYLMLKKAGKVVKKYREKKPLPPLILPPKPVALGVV
jgi:hypothetical protein